MYSLRKIAWNNPLSPIAQLGQIVRDIFFTYSIIKIRLDPLSERKGWEIGICDSDHIFQFPIGKS